MSRTSIALIAIGANLPSTIGSAGETLRMAMGILHDQPGITITACSRFWRTPAIPVGSGPDFCNAAMRLETGLGAEDLLQVLHETETRLGRDRSNGRWSPRVLDLDLLAHDGQILPDQSSWRYWADLPDDRQAVLTPDRLILPHPRLQGRGFVLAPLADIAPLWRHPVTDKSVAQMLTALPDAVVAGMTPCGDLL